MESKIINIFKDSMITRNIVYPLLNIFIPSICVFCDQPLPPGQRIICENCFNLLPRLDPDLITILVEEIKNRQFKKIIIPYQFSEELQLLIHLLKYKRFLSLGIHFGRCISKLINRSGYDLITSVPLHPVRERERGYNQSEIIAKNLAIYSGIPFHSCILKRTRNNPSQTKLDRDARKNNVEGLFQCLFNLDRLRILIIDDVITTGSTLNECCKSLLERGVQYVDIAALATPSNFLQKERETKSSGPAIF